MFTNVIATFDPESAEVSMIFFLFGRMGVMGCGL